MEVHHPHHVQHKKKWTEYAVEFFVLFIAVTLGYMAENIRETQIEKHREIAYLKNVHEDLQFDMKTIDSVVHSNSVRLDALDSFLYRLQGGKLELADIYYYVRNLALRSTFESSQAGFDQIKAAGGLRMVQNKQIVFGIQQYERQLHSTMKLEEVREATLTQARFKLAAVMDVLTIYEMSKTQTSEVLRFRKPENPHPLVKTDPATLNELYNLVVIGLNTNRYLNERLLALKKVGEDLDKAILDEYGKEME